MSKLKSITTAEFLRTGERKNWIDAQIRGDKFTTFVWRGKNSWEDYNCFITSDKRGLTWSNYGSIKNDYSSTMFGVNKTLLGTTVENKSITMNLCLYDVTMALYEEFLVWLNPQILGRLYIGIKPATDYKNDWFYKAKIGSIGDSTINYLGQDRYIIELKIVFETQDNYVYHEEPVVSNIDGEWELKPCNFRSFFNIIVRDAQPDTYIIKTSLKEVKTINTTTTTTEKTITTTTKAPVEGSPTEEPVITESELTLIGDPVRTIDTITTKKDEEIVNIRLTQGTAFEYSSAEGLLYKTDTGEPLSLLTSNAGQRVLESMLVVKKFIPSILEDGAGIKNIKKKSERFSDSQPNSKTEDGVTTSIITRTTKIDNIETIIEYSFLITIKNTKNGTELPLVDSNNNSKITVYRQDKCLIPMTQGGTD